MTMLPDLVCFSHLRWNFVFQRPQHLLSRFARERRVFFFEEPLQADGPARIEMNLSEEGVWVCVPHLPPGLPPVEEVVTLAMLVDVILREHEVEQFVTWYYTPMALPFTSHLRPLASTYDCMDELSAFKGASPCLLELEARLLRSVDLVTTGGQSLYEAKRARHGNVHAFPSSVDVPHFRSARAVEKDPADQALIPRPRLGYVGVIDERMNVELVGEIANLRPDWHLVLLGPVVKIDPASLPRAANLHWLGSKSYGELPSYLGGWDVALMPFAHNESTRYISPTKTPEYLAAGKPVVSTSIRDVVRPYGQRGLVEIADTPSEFVGAIQRCLSADRSSRIADADEFLAAMSWDATWAGIKELLDQACGLEEVGCSTISS